MRGGVFPHPCFLVAARGGRGQEDGSGSVVAGGLLVPRCVPAAPHPSGVEGGRTCVDVWDVKVCVVVTGPGSGTCCPLACLGCPWWGGGIASPRCSRLHPPVGTSWLPGHLAKQKYKHHHSLSLLPFGYVYVTASNFTTGDRKIEVLDYLQLSNPIISPKEF